MHNHKNRFIRTTKSTLHLHNALYNMAQTILHTHIFFKVICFRPWRFSRGNAWRR